MCCNTEAEIIGYRLADLESLVHTMQCPRCKTVWEERIIIVEKPMDRVRQKCEK